MAVSINATGLTAPQRQLIADAFIFMHGPFPEGTTDAQAVTRETLRFWKSVVKGYRRKLHEQAIHIEQDQVDTDIPEDIA